MIQRKQTLFLLFVTAILCWIAFGSVKIGAYNEIGDFGGFSADVYANGKMATDVPELTANLKNDIKWGHYIFASFAFVVFVTIFLFKKRKVQMQLCLLISFLIVGFTSFIIFKTGPQEYFWGIWVVVASILLLLLSWFFIRKDEKLVKSTSRFR